MTKLAQRILNSSASISILLAFATPLSAQDFGTGMLFGLGKSALSEGKELLNEAPDRLEEFLQSAEQGQTFPSSKECLGALQVAVNAGAVVANVLPFSSVETFEDGRGPVAKFRVMLNGEKVHLEAFCDDEKMSAVPLSWGEGSPVPERVTQSSLDAVAGLLLLLQAQGAFEKEAVKTAETQSSGFADGNTPSVFRSARDRYGQCRSTTIASGTSQIGGPFTLVDETGKTVTDADVIDQPTLIYFGYTSCPDVCPTDNARNAEAVEILERRGLMVKPVFISIDPERDTPELVGAFTGSLHERMLGLTGSPEQVRAVSRAYRTFHQKHNSDEENYLIDHSTMSYLVLPEEGFIEVFRRDLSPNDLADRIQCFLNVELTSKPVPEARPAQKIISAPIQTSVQQCWNVGSLSSEALRTRVKVAISLNEDGSPMNETLRMLSYDGGSSEAARQVFESARRAIIRCGANGFTLPDDWSDSNKEVILTFDPENMRIR